MANALLATENDLILRTEHSNFEVGRMAARLSDDALCTAVHLPSPKDKGCGKGKGKRPDPLARFHTERTLTPARVRQLDEERRFRFRLKEVDKHFDFHKLPAVPAYARDPQIRALPDAFRTPKAVAPPLLSPRELVLSSHAGRGHIDLAIEFFNRCALKVREGIGVKAQTYARVVNGHTVNVALPSAVFRWKCLNGSEPLPYGGVARDYIDFDAFRGTGQHMVGICEHFQFLACPHADAAGKHNSPMQCPCGRVHCCATCLEPHPACMCPFVDNALNSLLSGAERQYGRNEHFRGGGTVEIDGTRS